MATPVVIRAAQSGDVPRLGELGALLVHAHHEFDRRRFIPAGPTTAHHYASFLGSQIADADAVILVAERDRRVVGYGYAAIDGYDYMALRGPAAVLHDLIVDPQERGGGVGTLLLTTILSQLEGRAPRVVLSTAERNESAHRLFERFGFRRTMVEMTRELAGSS